MARRPPPGKCIHCLRDPVPRTWDHVLPNAWYPDSTPRDLEKWQVPACERCNAAYGRLEDDLRLRLGLGLDPDLAAASGIPDKVLRALDPAATSDPREARIRLAKRQQILAELIPGDQIPADAVLPGFGGPSGASRADLFGCLVPREGLDLLAHKITRGIAYLDGGHFIKPPYEIDLSVMTAEGAAPIEALLQAIGTEYARGPGLVIRRVVAPEDGLSAYMRIEIWGQLRIYTSVTDASRPTTLDPS